MVAEVKTRFGRHVAVFGPQLKIAESWLAAAEGNVSAAIEFALDAARLAAESGQQAIEMLALHDAVRFGDQSSLDRLVELRPRHRWPAGGGDRRARRRRCATATPRGSPRRQSNSSSSVRCCRRPMPPRRPRSRSRAPTTAAAAWRRPRPRTGWPPSAAESARPHLDLAAHPLPLTVREREIANLVAAGLSNRDIADRLTVSVRTVEGHLYRACIKLDISDREELAALIRTAAAVSPHAESELVLEESVEISKHKLSSAASAHALLHVRIRRRDLERLIGLDGRHPRHASQRVPVGGSDSSGHHTDFAVYLRHCHPRRPQRLDRRVDIASVGRHRDVLLTSLRRLH